MLKTLNFLLGQQFLNQPGFGLKRILSFQKTSFIDPQYISRVKPAPLWADLRVRGLRPPDTMALGVLSDLPSTPTGHTEGWQHTLLQREKRLSYSISR